MNSKFKPILSVVFFILVLSVPSMASAGRVNISSSGISISPSTVTIGQNFNISFSLQEYQGGSKTIEYVEIWIKDSSGNDLYRLDDYRWTNQTWSANQTRSYSATTFLDPDRRPPGGYKVAVRGYITGDPNGPFNFGIVGGADVNYYKSFTAVSPSGRVNISSSGISISPSTVTIGQNFNISFSLQEYQGGSKTIEYVEIWIKDSSGNDLYRLDDYRGAFPKSRSNHTCCLEGKNMLSQHVPSTSFVMRP